MGGVSPQLQALATALAATIGTGSIAGVATAIFFGGPGAVFWMWISALLGMMTGCAEKLLSVRYRRAGPAGWLGGPMYYIRDGLKSPLLAGLVCPGMPAGHPDRGRHGPVQLHCRRPPGHLRMGPAGGGGGRRGPDGAGDGGGGSDASPG